jgi:23S rRNA (guanosine2251-2'-O)-methyltransferase
LLLYSYMIPIILVLVDIRSTHNVGSLLRLADCFGTEQVIFTGYTPYPKIPDDKRLPHLINKITSSIHKTALGAEANLPMTVTANINEAIKSLKNRGYQIAAIEQSPNSVNLSEFTLKQPTALLLGNEVTGLPTQILNACDKILEIPQFGKKESLNVSTAAAIALYSLRIKT